MRFLSSIILITLAVVATLISFSQAEEEPKITHEVCVHHERKEELTEVLSEMGGHRSSLRSSTVTNMSAELQ